MAKTRELLSVHEKTFSKTSIGRNPSLCKMNKSKRRSFKQNRGQGK